MLFSSHEARISQTKWHEFYEHFVHSVCNSIERTRQATRTHTQITRNGATPVHKLFCDSNTIPLSTLGGGACATTSGPRAGAADLHHGKHAGLAEVVAALPARVPHDVDRLSVVRPAAPRQLLAVARPPVVPHHRHQRVWVGLHRDLGGRGGRG